MWLVPRLSSKEIDTGHKENYYPKFPHVALGENGINLVRSFEMHILATRNTGPDIDDLAHGLLRIVCTPNLPVTSLDCCCP